MARGRDADIEHLLRRAAFGSSQQEREGFQSLGLAVTLGRLLYFERVPDDVDSRIGQSGYVGFTPRGGAFSPNTNIDHARQRWLFRMVHTQRPLQEKMALFWHNHFATAYSKVNAAFGGAEATRMMAGVPADDPFKVKGQIELFREYALGNFRDLLIEVAKDQAMLEWLDGRSNSRVRPQENFARELMELFTMGVGTFVETDVYAGARVFTGWNLRRVGQRDAASSYYEFFYNANNHDTNAKEFSFPIYSDGSRTIPARSASDGMQDGIDLINGLARHPETARRLVRKLYEFFVSETGNPDQRFIDDIANTYLAARFELRPVVGRLLSSDPFYDQANRFARYSWPAEFVVRAIKEVGWLGFTIGTATDALVNMGQQLFEPPDVNGWALGQGWFSTGAMLARMNFAATLAGNQKFNLLEATRPVRQSPDELLSFFVDRLTPGQMDGTVRGELMNYLGAGGSWNGSDTQLATKSAGLARLILGTAEYQFV